MNKEMELENKMVDISRRLKALTDMVTIGNTVADVGCDHGFVSIYLVQNKISPAAVAMDVRTGPLERAREHVAMYGLEEQIQTRLSDGLDAFQIGEAQTCIIAGMGGKLMTKILRKDWKKTNSFRELILQPQSELEEFRVFLRTDGFEIVEENMLCEEGKYYFLFKVHPPKSEQDLPAGEDLAGDKSLNPMEDELQGLYDRYGKELLLKAHPVAKEYLLYRRGVLKDIAGNISGQNNERTAARHAEVLEEIQEIEKVLERFFE